MFEVRYDIGDERTGRRGFLRLAGGIWHGDVCVFEFADTVFGLAGTAACDWRAPCSDLRVLEGDGTSPGALDLLAKIRTLLLPFHRSAFADVTPQQLQALYAADYHATMNYAVDSPAERRFKQTVVEQVLALASPRKVLDAGCSAGEVVRQLRARGVDAWGFDLCPDLETIAYPEVRDYVRRGSIDAIPFGPEDGFDTLLALDVFEHVPEHRIGAMVSEFARLGVRRVVAHVALCEFQYPGHITLRPLSWWDRQLAPWFRRTAPSAQADAAAVFAADPSRYLRVYELAEVPALA